MGDAQILFETGKGGDDFGIALLAAIVPGAVEIIATKAVGAEPGSKGNHWGLRIVDCRLDREMADSAVRSKAVETEAAWLAEGTKSGTGMKP